MIKQQSQHQTQAGYLKADVYSELEAAALKRDYERVCYLAVELVCTPKEVKSFLTFWVRMYAKHYLSSNSWVLETIHSCMEQLLKIAKKKKYLDDNEFRKTVCKVVLTVVQEKQKAMDNVMRASPHETERVANISAGESAIEARYTDMLSSEPKRKLGALLFHLLRSDVNASLLSLAALLRVAGKQHVQPARFEFVIDMTESNRTDIAWYVWDVLLVESRKLVGKPGHNAHDYVRNALGLYTLCYAKKVRAERVNYLVYSVFVVAQQGARRMDRNTPLVKHAARNIDIVFAEILGLPSSRMDYLQYYTTR